MEPNLSSNIPQGAVCPERCGGHGAFRRCNNPRQDKTNEHDLSATHGWHGSFQCRVGPDSRGRNCDGRSGERQGRVCIADHTCPSGRAREEGGEEEAGSCAAEAACSSCKNSARRSGSTFPEASDTAHYCKAAGAHCTTGSRPSSHAAARRSGACAAACCTRRTARCPTGCTRTAACCSRSTSRAAASRAGPAT